MRLSIIVPIYFNDLSLYQTIDKCISSLKRYYPNEEYLIIDDGSPIEPEWCNIKNEVNQGYTKTVNVGLKKSKQCRIVVINDDVIIRAGDLDKFYDMEYGIYSPKTTDEGVGDKFGSIWGLTRKTLEDLGYMDETLRHFFSDSAYYDRAKRKNIPIVKWDYVVEHLGGMTYDTLNKEELYAKDECIYMDRNPTK